MFSDLRFAFRQLAKSPGFTAVAVLTLALGIGANTAIFSVINAALLRPLQYPASEQLVELWSRTPGGFQFNVVTGPQFKHVREHATSLTDGAGFRKFDLNLIDRGQAERVPGLEVSANYLRTLRRSVLLGRDFPPEADQLGGANRVVILTYEWWQSRFGGDRAIIGRAVTFGQATYEVIGVLAPHTLVNDEARFLTPLVLEDGAWRMSPDAPWIGALFRLRPGFTAGQAEQEIRPLDNELNARLQPERKIRPSLVVRPLQSLLTEATRPTLLMLLGAVVLVLFIACANVGAVSWTR